jgi:hypothetical protein
MNTLDKYFEIASSQIEQTVGLGEIEPLFVEVLEFIQNHPEKHKDFEHQFVLALEEGLAPWELIQFCMRVLQWESIRESALATYERSADFRIKSVMKDILAVYEPTWEDEDLYKYFRVQS